MKKVLGTLIAFLILLSIGAAAVDARPSYDNGNPHDYDYVPYPYGNPHNYGHQFPGNPHEPRVTTMT